LSHIPFFPFFLTFLCHSREDGNPVSIPIFPHQNLRKKFGDFFRSCYNIVNGSNKNVLTNRKYFLSVIPDLIGNPGIIKMDPRWSLSPMTLVGDEDDRREELDSRRHGNDRGDEDDRKKEKEEYSNLQPNRK